MVRWLSNPCTCSKDITHSIYNALLMLHVCLHKMVLIARLLIFSGSTPFMFSVRVSSGLPIIDLYGAPSGHYGSYCACTYQFPALASILLDMLDAGSDAALPILAISFLLCEFLLHVLSLIMHSFVHW